MRLHETFYNIVICPEREKVYSTCLSHPFISLPAYLSTLIRSICEFKSLGTDFESAINLKNTIPDSYFRHNEIAISSW